MRISTDRESLAKVHEMCVRINKGAPEGGACVEGCRSTLVEELLALDARRGIAAARRSSRNRHLSTLVEAHRAAPWCNASVPLIATEPPVAPLTINPKTRLVGGPRPTGLK